MCSLTSAVSLLRNVLDDNSIETNREVVELSKLAECLMPTELHEWHLTSTAWIRENTNCRVLEQLCTRSIEHSISAAYGAFIVWDLANTESRLQENISNEDRQLIKLALADVLEALKQFYIVCRTPALHAEHKMKVILHYLEVALRIGIALGSVIAPELSDHFFYWEECIEATKLKDFHFDDGSYFNRVADRFLTGVIPPSDQVPQNYLPIHAEPPVVIRNSSTDGSLIIPNGYNHPLVPQQCFADESRANMIPHESMGSQTPFGDVWTNVDWDFNAPFSANLYGEDNWGSPSC